MFQDLRYAVRQWMRAPAVAVLAILTLGIGIGVSTAIFILLDGLWFRPMDVPSQSELVRLFSNTPEEKQDAFSFPEFQRIQSSVPALKSVVAKGGRGGRLVRADGSLRLLLVNVVSENFFEDLGIRPQYGRLFGRKDADALRSAPGVVLGHSFWMDEFGGDPSIVGKQIKLLRRDTPQSFTVLGILPASFRDTDADATRDMWFPPQTWESLNGTSDFERRNFRWFYLIGRLAPGASVPQLQTQMRTVGLSLASEWPEANKNRSFAATTDFRYRLDSAGVTGEVLIAVVAMVMLLSIVNVAQLLLARGLARRREFAMRQVLGARRLALLRPLIVENLLLAIVSFVAGLAIAFWATRLIPRFIVSVPLHSFDNGLHFGMDLRLLAAGAGVALLSALLISLVPLWQTAGVDLVTHVKSSSSHDGGTRASLAHRCLVASQVAVAIALLVATGVLVRSFVNTRVQDLGMARNNILSVWVLGNHKEARQQFMVARERIAGLPGVKQVAYAVRAPLSLSSNGMAKMVLLPANPEMKDAVSVKFNAVSANFLDTMGTPLLRGRSFSEAEVHAGEHLAVVNETAVRRFWRGVDPLGQILRAGRTDYRVVGVARNAPINRVGELEEPYFYIPYEDVDDGEITFLVRTSQAETGLARPIRDLLVDIDPKLDPASTTSIAELIRYSAGEYQMTAELVSVLGGVGLILTIAGLYGFISYRVTQRTREIGIRMALGSTQDGAIRTVLSESAKIGAAGMLIGFPLSIFATRLASSMLFGVRAWDAVSWILATTLLLLSLWLASYIPARRAARIEPMEALRSE